MYIRQDMVNDLGVGAGANDHDASGIVWLRKYCSNGAIRAAKDIPVLIHLLIHRTTIRNGHIRIKRIGLHQGIMIKAIG